MTCKTTGASTELGFLDFWLIFPTITGNVTYPITNIAYGSAIGTTQISTPNESVWWPIFNLTVALVASVSIFNSCLDGSYYVTFESL